MLLLILGYTRNYETINLGQTTKFIVNYTKLCHSCINF
jgi:hypothetical protein